jgi:hypothetical protein
LASKVSKIALDRRQDDLNGKYSDHFSNRLFDPQLYLSEIDTRARKECTKLASYPWFPTGDIQGYDSDEMTQSDWKNEVSSDIDDIWKSVTPSSLPVIEASIRACIKYQLSIGCDAIILPSPLTTNPSSQYTDEATWIDKGVEVANELDVDIPVLATIALQDNCLRFQRPPNNHLINQIADSVSARGVDGAYVVLEQSSEPQNQRHCAHKNVLWSILNLSHLLGVDANLTVVASYLGAYGLACRAAGADAWSTGWYKSLYRLRIPDLAGTGRARPRYWSFPAAISVHLKSDFDDLSANNLIGGGPLDDATPASNGLLTAAKQGSLVRHVPDWEYTMNNVTAARDHFLASVFQEEKELQGLNRTDRVDYIHDWLKDASTLTSNVAQTLGAQPDTNLDHVQVWEEAFDSYRSQFGV